MQARSIETRTVGAVCTIHPVGYQLTSVKKSGCRFIVSQRVMASSSLNIQSR